MSSDKILRNTLDMMSLEGRARYSMNGCKVIEWLIDNEIVMGKV